MLEKRKNRNWLNSLNKMYKSEEYTKLYPEMLLYIDKYPNDYYGLYLYAKLLMQIGRKEETKEVLEKVSDCNIKIRYQSCLILADIYADEGKKQEAKEMIKYQLEDSRIIDRSKKIALANIYIKLGELSDASNTINTINVKGASFSELINLADVLNKLGNIKESEELLEKISLNSLPTRKLLQLAEIRERNKSYNKALGIVRLIISKIEYKNEYYYQCKYKECALLIKRNDLDKAINNCYEMLLENNSDKDKVYLMLGDAYKRKCNYKEAKEFYETVLYSSNKDMKEDALYRLGILNEIAGHFEEARLINQSLIDSDSKFKLDAYFKIISLDIKEGNFHKAYELFDSIKHILYQEQSYIGTRITSVYLKSRLGIEQDVDDSFSYVEKQMIEYSEEKSKQHILEHRRQSNSNFNEEIDFDSLYEYTKTMLTEDNICYGDFLDVYEIDYENIANNMNRYRVIAIPHTNNIITMYPIEKNDNRYQRLSSFQEQERIEKLKEETKKQKLYGKYFRN